MRRASVDLFERLEQRTLLSLAFESVNAFGSPGGDNSRAVEVDAAGNVWHLGMFSGATDLDPGPGTAIVGTGNDEGQAEGATYLSKLDKDDKFLWGFEVQQDGGRAFGSSLTDDTAGNIYVSGVVIGENDAREVFLAKYNPSGELLWTRRSSLGSSTLIDFQLGSDAAGNVVMTGQFTGPLDFDGDDTAELDSGGVDELDAFVVKFGSDGNVVWARSLETLTGTRDPDPRGVAVDSSGNVFVTGPEFMDDPTGPMTPDPGPLSSFLLKLDAEGDRQWMKKLDARSTTMGVDAAGNVYTSGTFKGTVDFDPGPGTRKLTSPPSTTDTIFTYPASDIFIQKLDKSGNFVWAVDAADSDDLIGGDPKLAVTNTGEVYLVAQFKGTADFDQRPGGCTNILTGEEDAFLLKLDNNGRFLEAGFMGSASAFNDQGWFNTVQPVDIAVNQKGDVVVGGLFAGTVDIDPTSAQHELTSASYRVDAFVLRLGDQSAAQPSGAKLQGLSAAKRKSAHHKSPAQKLKSLKAAVKSIKAQIKEAKADGEDVSALREQLKAAKVALKKMAAKIGP